MSGPQIPWLFLGSQVSRPEYEALLRAGLPLDFLDLADVIDTMQLDFSASAVRLTLPGHLRLEERRVWYHPGSFDLLEHTLLRAAVDSDYQFIARQLRAFTLYFETWLARHCGECFDDPVKQRYWSSKLQQLNMLALDFPDLLIASRVSSRASSVSVGDIVKHISESRMVDSASAFYAQTITPVLTSQGSAGEHPVLTQPALDTAVEYRAVCCDDEVVTLELPRLHSPTPGAVVDVHFYPAALEAVRVVPSPVPSHPWAAMRDRLGLRHFAVDFLIGEAGPRVLEVNPLFSWSWLPEDSLLAVADLLERSLRKDS